MMLPSFLAPLPPLLLLMLLRAARLHAAAAAAAPLRTFRNLDPNTGATLECHHCAPGTYMRARCTSTQRSDCAPCPAGSYTELWNYISKCLRCAVCGHNQVVKTECAADRDRQCECRHGFYYKRSYDMCVRHSECPAGQGVLTHGSPDADTVCHVCPDGAFSNAASAHHECQQHKSCPGLQVVLRGSTWHDSVCTSCQELASRDGANILREILPSLFSHQKLSLRRLRQVVNRLPSEDGRRPTGTAALSLSELQERLSAWIALASAAQIRQLPVAISRAGAGGTGDKIESKLQRIESRLKELCLHGNEVSLDR